MGTVSIYEYHINRKLNIYIQCIERNEWTMDKKWKLILKRLKASKTKQHEEVQ